MTNTGTPAPYLSNFDKVAALVNVENSGFMEYDGPTLTPALQAGIDEGFLVVWREDFVRLTPAGRERLAGFRALLAPL